MDHNVPPITRKFTPVTEHAVIGVTVTGVTVFMVKCKYFAMNDPYEFEEELWVICNAYFIRCKSKEI